MAAASFCMATFRRWFENCLAGAIELTTITWVDEGNNPVDVVQGAGADGIGPDGKPSMDGSRRQVRAEGWGDIVLPPRNQRALHLRRLPKGFIIPLGSPRYRPKTGKPGSRGWYNDIPGFLIMMRGSQEKDGAGNSIAGQYEITTPAGASVIIDKDGNVTATPAPGKHVQLGDSAAANLDPIVLYTGLKAQFDAFVDFFNAHDHMVAAGMAVQIPILEQASHLTTAAQSSNVTGRK